MKNRFPGIIFSNCQDLLTDIIYAEHLLLEKPNPATLDNVFFHIYGRRINKVMDHGHWENAVLEQAQIDYAVIDVEVLELLLQWADGVRDSRHLGTAPRPLPRPSSAARPLFSGSPERS